MSRQAQDRDVYLVVSGKVCVMAFSYGGRQVSYREIAAGEWFGELAAIDGRPRSADIEALEDTLLASMAPTLFRQLITDVPLVRDRVLTGLTGLIRDLSGRMLDLSALCVAHRVHAEVLRLAKQAGIQANRARIDPAPKHWALASKIGTYREAVTRELSAMVKQDLLERRRGAWDVIDVARLEQFVAAAAPA